jgi:chromosome segregation ATPase
MDAKRAKELLEFTGTESEWRRTMCIHAPELAATVVRQAEDLTQRDAEISRLQAEIVGRDSEILRLRDAEIVRQAAEIAERTQSLTTQAQQLLAQSTEIIRLRSELDHAEGRLDSNEETARSQIAERDAEIARLSRRIAALESTDSREELDEGFLNEAQIAALDKAIRIMVRDARRRGRLEGAEAMRAALGGELYCFNRTPEDIVRELEERDAKGEVER